MSNPIQLTNEQFQEVLAAINTSRSHIVPAPTQATQAGSLANCTARFGVRVIRNKVEEFISAASIFKDVSNIDDRSALLSLLLLLEDIAANWWQGVKTQVTTWEEALKLLRHSFAPTRAAHHVYCDLFSSRQEDGVSTDLFVCEKRALLAELPANSHTEEQQLDLIFGLLHINIRSHLTRENVGTFQELLEKARAIEDTLRERKTRTHKEALPGNSAMGKLNEGIPRKRVKCEYCRNFGHTAIECRNRERADREKTHVKHPTEVHGTESLKCYGCGKPGYVRSQCPECSKPNKPTNIGFCSFDID